jgi:hypothetical protein
MAQHFLLSPQAKTLCLPPPRAAFLNRFISPSLM